jgi:cytochrome c biogenesis protein
MQAPPIEAHTTPPPRVPQSPARFLKSGWRKLRQMRTAIILLFVLAAGASVGSLFPQRPVNELKVNDWIANHSSWARLAEWFGLFDVYGSWWFTAIYVLLLVSVVGCIVPRYLAIVRQMRSRPRTDGTLTGLQEYRETLVPVPPERALAEAERSLRRGRFRIVRADGTVAGEKGHIREVGSILFHTAFLVLLLGIVVGKGFGFSGQVAVVEGERFTDTHVAYDQINEGRFFNERHRGFSVELTDFNVEFHENGIPKEFISRIRVYEDDEQVDDTRIRVNEPFVYRGVNVFQLAWGYAPRVVVSQNGNVLSDGPVIVLQDSQTGAWRGVVKVPQTKPRQLGLELYFYNDLQTADTNDDGSDDLAFNRSPYARRPVLFFQSFRGDLGLDRPQSVYVLDKTAMSASTVGGVPVAGTTDLGDGITVSFPEVKQYSVFQIASDPGTPIMLAAAILILVGLLTALYSSRRRVWIRASPDAAGTRVEVAGQAFQRKAAFEEEFKALVRNLDRDLARSGPSDG